MVVLRSNLFFSNLKLTENFQWQDSKYSHLLLHTKYASVFYLKWGHSPRKPAYIPQMSIMRQSCNNPATGPLQLYQLPQLYGIVFFHSNLVFFFLLFFLEPWLRLTLIYKSLMDLKHKMSMWSGWPFLSGFFHWGHCQLSLSIHMVACINPTFFKIVIKNT